MKACCFQLASVATIFAWIHHCARLPRLFTHRVSRALLGDEQRVVGRFAQSPQKGDTALYRRSLEQSSKKWLRQLESMGLRRAS